MSANVETMFYTRVTPWHGLGTRVEEAPDSREALLLAGLDWQVIQKPIMTGDGQPIDGFKANIRDRDGQVLGVVTDRYKVVQNEDAFAFTDELLGEGVVYETAGSLQKGRRTLCDYDTGCGRLTMGVYARAIHANLADRGGTLDFHYTLDINSDMASSHDIYITVKEAGPRS